MPIEDYFPHFRGRDRSPVCIGVSETSLGSGLYRLTITDVEKVLVRDKRVIGLDMLKKEALKLARVLEDRGYTVEKIKT